MINLGKPHHQPVFSIWTYLTESIHSKGIQQAKKYYPSSPLIVELHIFVNLNAIIIELEPVFPTNYTKIFTKN